MHFTDTVVVPHMDNAKYGSIVAAINDKLKSDGFKTAPLGDTQALIIDGKSERVLG
jgi:dipeptidase E